MSSGAAIFAQMLRRLNAARAARHKAKTSRPARFTIFFSECEHRGDLDNYLADVVRAGGVVVSSQLEPEEDEYETGSAVVEAEDVRMFVDRLDETEAGEFARFVDFDPRAHPPAKPAKPAHAKPAAPAKSAPVSPWRIVQLFLDAEAFADPEALDRKTTRVLASVDWRSPDDDDKAGFRALGGFDYDEDGWVSPPMTAAEARPIRDAIEAREVTHSLGFRERDVTHEYVIGRTAEPDRLDHARTITLDARAVGGRPERIVAIPLDDRDPQIKRYGGGFVPLDLERT